jgi:hypothetical protein
VSDLTAKFDDIHDERGALRCQIVDCWGVAVPESLVCEFCFAQIGQAYVEARTILSSKFQRLDREARLERYEETEAARAERERARSVVYYVRLGDHVKIGYTTCLTARTSQLRVDRDMVLAVEPGWRELEAERHAQFADERQGRREDFNPSRRLLAHIEQVRAANGDPFDLASALAQSALRMQKSS